MTFTCGAVRCGAVCQNGRLGASLFFLFFFPCCCQAPTERGFELSQRQPRKAAFWDKPEGQRCGTGRQSTRARIFPGPVFATARTPLVYHALLCDLGGPSSHRILTSPRPPTLRLTVLSRLVSAERQALRRQPPQPPRQRRPHPRRGDPDRTTAGPSSPTGGSGREGVAAAGAAAVTVAVAEARSRRTWRS